MLRKEVSESQRQTGAGNPLEISMGQWALEKSCVPSHFPAIQHKRDKLCSRTRWGSPTASRIEGHMPRRTVPILGGAAVCVCRALQWAISFTVREREVAGGPLHGLQESGLSVSHEEGGRCVCECDDWARC